jgi:hypothetical protein
MITNLLERATTNSTHVPRDAAAAAHINDTCDEIVEDTSPMSSSMVASPVVMPGSTANGSTPPI